MQILPTSSYIKPLYTQKLSHDEVKKIKREIVENVNRYTFTDFVAKNISWHKLSPSEKIFKNMQDFQNFLYNNRLIGKNSTKISQFTFSKPAFLDMLG